MRIILINKGKINKKSGPNLEATANLAQISQAPATIPQPQQASNLDPQAQVASASDIGIKLAEAKTQTQALDPSANISQAAMEKMRKLKDFNGVAENFSKFEAAMAGLGTIFTGGNSDWLAYFHESVGEYASNHLASAEEGEKELNPLVKGIFKLVSFLFGIKNKEGKNLESTNDFVKVQDKLIGALNMFTSVISFAVIGLKSVPAAIRGDESEGIKIPGLHFASTKLMPLVNATLMWMSGAAKRRLAFDIQKEAYNDENKAEIDGSFTSGSEDYICGANSAGLMVRQAIAAVNPRLATILEPVFATWIAGSAMKAGYEAYKEVEEDEPKFELSNLDKSVFGKTFYNIAKAVSAPMGVDLPDLTTLQANAEEKSVELPSQLEKPLTKPAPATLAA
jgi:hypothetical protein